VAKFAFHSEGHINTIGAELLHSLEQAIQKARDHKAQGILFTSENKKSFLDGANLSEIRSFATQDDLLLLVEKFLRILADLAAMPVPVVAVLKGQTALGGGFELLLAACDHVVATEDSRMGFPEVNLGLIPGGGGTQTLRRAVGLKACCEIILGGKVLPSTAFAGTSWITIAETQDLWTLAQTWIETHQGILHRNLDPQYQEPEVLEEEERRSLFEALRQRYAICPDKPHFSAALDAIEAGLDKELASGLKEETRRFLPLLFDPRSLNKMDLFFLTTSVGPTLFQINPARVIPTPRIAILGAGLMGQGIAQVAADAGIHVLLLDIREDIVDSALENLSRITEGLVNRKRWQPKRRDALLAHLKGSTEYDLLSEYPLVIEAIPEELSLKQKILQQTQEIQPNILFASNSSALPMELIAEHSNHPENVVGMHYFSPVPLMALLEVIRGKESSMAAVDTAVALGRLQGKTCVVVQSAPGFFTTRIFVSFVNMGFHLAERGVDPFEVDRLAVEAGFPRGPLHMFGSVGGTISHHIGHFLEKSYPNRHEFPRSIDLLVASGFTGAGNASFYLDERGSEPNTRALDHLVHKRGLPLPNRAEIKDMLLLSMVSDAFAAYSDGIIDSLIVMDLAASLGVGFPDCWQGPARYVSCKGVRAVVHRMETLAQRFEMKCLVPSNALLDLIQRGIDTGLN